MARGYMTLDSKTNELRYVPPWPPRPQRGDFWSKPSSKGTLTRKVLEVSIGRVRYRNDLGNTRECRIDAFVAWCRGAKILSRGNKRVIYADD